METSAKNATNVEQAFMAMAASIKNRFENSVEVALITVTVMLFSCMETYYPMHL